MAATHHPRPAFPTRRVEGPLVPPSPVKTPTSTTTSQAPACRIQLVARAESPPASPDDSAAANNHHHDAAASTPQPPLRAELLLGPWTLPPPGAEPTLAQFAETVRRLVRSGDDGLWWRFEYEYLGHSVVPILSDLALVECFAHMRERHASLPPHAAARECRLLLTATRQPPSEWRLFDNSVAAASPPPPPLSAAVSADGGSTATAVATSNAAASPSSPVLSRECSFDSAAAAARAPSLQLYERQLAQLAAGQQQRALPPPLPQPPQQQQQWLAAPGLFDAAGSLPPLTSHSFNDASMLVDGGGSFSGASGFSFFSLPPSGGGSGSFTAPPPPLPHVGAVVVADADDDAGFDLLLEEYFAPLLGDDGAVAVAAATSSPVQQAPAAPPAAAPPSSLPRGSSSTGGRRSAAAATAPPPTRAATTTAPSGKGETKTKYADGRFKDDARHAARMSYLAAKCTALFDGAAEGLYEIQTHKRVGCRLCGAGVTLYEAYHTDAVRKHFVRHHEPELLARGADVDRWRQSCAPGGAAGGAGGAGGTAGRKRGRAGAAAPAKQRAAATAATPAAVDVQAQQDDQQQQQQQQPWLVAPATPLDVDAVLL